jgi:SAM-dependent methyltransferase
MAIDQLKDYYEDSAHRFWDPSQGMVGRDLHIYPLLDGLKGVLLEYGCGSGSLLLELAKEDRFSQCIGVDISRNALDLVERAWTTSQPGKAAKLKLVMPSDDQLPTIPDSSVDVLVSLATIEHVINPYVVLDELYRVGADNSMLIATVPNYAYIKHVAQLLFGIQPRTGTDDPVEQWREVGWDGMHIHTFTKSSFGTLLRDCGWEPITWRGWGNKLSSLGFGVLRKHFPGKWSGEITALCRKIPGSARRERNKPANLTASFEGKTAAKK